MSPRAVAALCAVTAPKGRLHLSPGQAQRSPGSGKERHGGLKGHFKNEQKQVFWNRQGRQDRQEYPLVFMVTNWF